MRGRVLGLLAILASTGAVCAADTSASDLAAIDKRLKACMDQDQSNVGMLTCTGTASESADKILNRIYGAARSDLAKGGDGDAAGDKEILRRLTASERAWIAYRDAECSLQGTDMLGGSGESLAIETCVYELTAQRAKSLADRFADK